MFRVTYIGQGVVSNALGAFQNGTIAYTDDESVAKGIASSDSFEVLSSDGRQLQPPFVSSNYYAELEGDAASPLAVAPRHFKKSDKKIVRSEDEEPS